MLPQTQMRFGHSSQANVRRDLCRVKPESLTKFPVEWLVDCGTPLEHDCFHFFG